MFLIKFYIDLYFNKVKKFITKMRLFNNIMLIIAIIYVQSFPHGAPSKTCAHYLPIGRGKSHHGSYQILV